MSDLPSILDRFLAQYQSDQDAGVDRSLHEYLGMFPGHDLSIARELLRLRHVANHDRDASVIGPYETLREIGRGGQGVVYRARHIELGHEVALKVLRGLGPGSGDLLERFHREARVAARLQHPGICSVVDAGMADGVPYMAMQFVEGETLQRRINDALERAEAGSETRVVEFFESMGASSYVDPETNSTTGAEDSSTQDDRDDNSSSLDRREIAAVLRLIEEAARALHAAHEAGVLHRDIKPANIMVRADGHPVLLDFGLSRSDDEDLASLTQSGDIFGTPAYMSPEQLEDGGTRLDARTDVWSLGVTLFECLTLRRPFVAQSRDSLYYAITTEDAPDPRRLNSRINRDLAIVVGRALERDRDRRYSSAEALAEELRRVRQHEPISARAVRPWTRVQRWAQRHPAVAALLVALILVLSTATVLTSRSAMEAREALVEKSAALEREGDAVVKATTALTEYERLADSQRLKNANLEADELWPIRPELFQLAEGWLQLYQPLVDNLPIHRRALERIREQALPLEPGRHELDFSLEYDIIADNEAYLPELERRLELAENDDERDEVLREVAAAKSHIAKAQEAVKGRRTYEFDDAELMFRHEILSDLIERLEVFAGESSQSRRHSMRLRLERSRRIADLTTSGPRARAAWDAARERIQTNDRYRIDSKLRAHLSGHEPTLALFDARGRMTLAPQIGLIPLGPDPKSGLEEFLHLLSHEHDWKGGEVVLPERKALDSSRAARLHSAVELGVVLVLLPAGSFLMGSQGDDSEAPNYERQRFAVEGPVHTVHLAPYFISKFEMTNAQWARSARLAGLEPFGPARYGPQSDDPTDPAHRSSDAWMQPVESVSWEWCHDLTRRMGMTLPTEAQWEYAARGGAADQSWSGTDDLADLARLANLSGRETASAAPSWKHEPAHEDPFVIMAPVGSFDGNGFGLHDMSGNVWEWCRDHVTEYEHAARPGDGLRDSLQEPVLFRGGGFNSASHLVRVAVRNVTTPDTRDYGIGLRPARQIDLP